MATTPKAAAARKKAALDCIKKLDAAAASLHALLAACNACEDGSGDHQRGIADSRTMLVRDINEYSGWLDRAYNTSPKA